jgi:hypothetical protein
MKESILIEAERLTNGDRQESYGHPADEYNRVAMMISGLLCDKLTEGITAQEAIMIMICVKMSRESHKPKRDNRVDIVGYGNCLDMVEQKEVKQCQLKK